MLVLKFPRYSFYCARRDIRRSAHYAMQQTKFSIDDMYDFIPKSISFSFLFRCISESIYRPRSWPNCTNEQLPYRPSILA